MKKVIAFGLLLAVGFLASCSALPATPAATLPAVSMAPASAPSPSAVPKTMSTNTPAAPAASVTPASTTALGPVAASIRLAEAYPALSFEKPLYFTVDGSNNQMSYVVEQPGRIKVLTDGPDIQEATTFLDLSGKVDANGNEKGLLGLAFHPNYTKNGYLYVNYTTRQSTVIARYTRRADNPMQADPASEQILLTFKQPYANHNGGQLAFGPDGYLYIGTGDGGSAGDPQNNAQNPKSLLGKILRINVDKVAGKKSYSIPSDNPYAGNGKGYREEIYALGLRNPWRFSFDQQGTLWVGDVGQNKWEEIDRVVKGGNYGWNVMEGTHSYKPNRKVDPSILLPPVWEYSHNPSECIIGGYVYSGDLLPDLKGRYIYGDNVSGKIWALWIDSAGVVHNEELIDSDIPISSFGITADGDIRIVGLSGKIYRLESR